MKTKFSSRSYAAIVATLAVAIVILVNMVMGTMPQTWTKLDGSGGIFTLDPITADLLDRTSMYDINIYYLITPGSEERHILDFVARYTVRSNVTLTIKNPLLYPAFVREYFGEDFPGSGLVVSSHRRGMGLDTERFFRYHVYDQGRFAAAMTRHEFNDHLVRNMDLFTRGILTFEQYFMGESMLTSAIDFATTDILPVIYNLTGHGGDTFDAHFENLISENNIELRQLNLYAQTRVPETASAVIINNPIVDLRDSELDMLLAFVGRGGHIMLITSEGAYDLPNLAVLTAHFSASAAPGFISESGGNYHTHPNFIFPAITMPYFTLDLPVYAPNSHGIITPELLPNYITMQNLLTSSRDSTIPGEEEPMLGPHTLALLAQRHNAVNPDGMLLWIASPHLLDEELATPWPGNRSFVLACVIHVSGRAGNVSISATNITTPLLAITNAQANVVTAITTAVIPLVIMSVGLYVHISRRRR